MAKKSKKAKRRVVPQSDVAAKPVAVDTPSVDAAAPPPVTPATDESHTDNGSSAVAVAAPSVAAPLPFPSGVSDSHSENSTTDSGNHASNGSGNGNGSTTPLADLAAAFATPEGLADSVSRWLRLTRREVMLRFEQVEQAQDVRMALLARHGQQQRSVLLAAVGQDYLAEGVKDPLAYLRAAQLQHLLPALPHSES